MCPGVQVYSGHYGQHGSRWAHQYPQRHTNQPRTYLQEADDIWPTSFADSSELFKELGLSDALAQDEQFQRLIQRR